MMRIPPFALALACLALTSANAAPFDGPDAAAELMLHDLEQVETGWYFVQVPADGSIPPPREQCIDLDKGAKTMFGLDMPRYTSPPDLLEALRGHGHTAMLHGTAADDHILLIVDSDTEYPLARGRIRCLALGAELEYRLHHVVAEATARPVSPQVGVGFWYVIDMNGRGPVSCVPASTLIGRFGGDVRPDADPHALADALVATGQHLMFVTEDDAKGTGSVFMGYPNSPTEQAYVLDRGLSACQAQKNKINSALLMSRLQSR